MAYIENPDEEELKQKSVLAPELSGAEGAPVDVAGGGASAPKSSPEVSGQGGFTDVNAYLDANREQASQMGDTVAGKIGQEGTAFRSGIDNDLNTFKSDVEQNRVQVDEGIIGDALNDPTKIANDAAKKASFQKMYAGQYGGPTEFLGAEKYGEYRNKATDLDSRFGNITGKDAIKNTLYSTGKNPTLGQVELDQLLLSGDPSARAKIEGEAAKYKDLGAYLDQQVGVGDQAVASAQEEAATAKERAGQVKTKADTLYSGIREKADKAGQYAQSYESDTARLKSLFPTLFKDGRATLSADDRALLERVTGAGKSGAYEDIIDFTKYQMGPSVFSNPDMFYQGFFGPGTAPTAGPATDYGVASAKEAADIQALQSLIDENYQLTGDPTQAGSYVTASPGTAVAPRRTAEETAALYAPFTIGRGGLDSAYQSNKLPGETMDQYVNRISQLYGSLSDQYFNQ